MGTDLWVTLGELKGFCVVYGITWLFTRVWQMGTETV